MTINPDTSIVLSPAQIDVLSRRGELPPIQHTDYKQFRMEQYEPLGELWDENADLSENLMNLAKEAVVLPYSNIQLPICIAYSLIPSAMASVVPILFFQGDKGSGKSAFSILLSELHKSEIKSVTTTFAALRNHINSMRWHDPIECEGERNYCLIFDNVNRETLKNENIYTLFLNGYNRKTDAMSTSKGNGENITFKVFGTKVVSSIYPLYVQSTFGEFNRRCIVVKCKPFEKMTLLEKESLELPDDYTINERLDLETLDLSILNKEYTKFWENKANLAEYAAIRRKLATRRKTFKIPDVIDGAKWTISIDLIVTGIVSGVWDSIAEAVDAMAGYWEWYNLNVASSFGATHKILKDFIQEETSIAEKTNAELGYEATEREINTEKLKKHLNQASSQGMLEISPTPSLIAEIMADLGWTLDKGKQGQICWVPSLR